MPLLLHVDVGHPPEDLAGSVPFDRDARGGGLDGAMAAGKAVWGGLVTVSTCKNRPPKQSRTPNLQGDGMYMG